MLVSDVLSGKQQSVVTVRPETPVEELLARLAEHNIGAILVSSDGETVTGIVSERDVVRALARSRGDVLGQPVRNLMTEDITTASPKDSIEHLMGLMTERRIRHIPVLVEGKLVGIVSIGDVVKSRMEELTSEREHLISYISSGS
ncbi:MAG: CBS domain-containing protein [Frankiaceae bacterium]|jgi:CBS domain-containing protein